MRNGCSPVLVSSKNTSPASTEEGYQSEEKPWLCRPHTCPRAEDSFSTWLRLILFYCSLMLPTIKTTSDALRPLEEIFNMGVFLLLCVLYFYDE
jgi:hypothetical protein